MSGGSFNYLCYKDGYDLIEESAEDDLCRMANTIESYGLGGEEVVKHIKLMLGKMLEVKKITQELTDLSIKSEEVFKAVEWFESCDSSKELALKAIREFN